jgi:hypothetical protein
MRSLRAGTAAGLLGLVLLCTGWGLSAAGATKPAARTASSRAASPTLTTNGLNSALRRQLQAYLLLPRSPVAPRPRIRVPLLAPRELQLRPRGTVCPVAAGGFCSLTPCIQFAGAGSGTAVPSAVIAATAGGPAVLRPSLAGPIARPALPPGRPGCQGRRAPPETLRVSGT